MIDIEEKNLATIKSIFQRLIPGIPVWAFGSRTNQTAKPYSDLDLVIVGESRIPQAVYYQIKDALEKSDIPFKVDVLDWHRISPAFKAVIEQHYEIMQPR